MKLTTRLLVLLVPTVAAIMTLYAVWAMIEREETLVPVLRRETEAYATSLALALSDQPPGSVQALLDRISVAPTVYAILVYDSTGAATIRSGPRAAQTPAPPDTLARVLGGAVTSFERLIGQERVYVVLRPLVDEATGRVVGALEVAQPFTVVAAEKVRVRRRFVLNTLTLLVAVTLLTLWLVRRMVAGPIARFETAVQALGRGDLGHRVPVDPRAGELAPLAQSINHMAESLETARRVAEREAEERVTLERRMRETEKLAAVGNLAAGLAHEIAAPLNVISGRAELLLRQETAPPERERNLRSIIQQIDRITGTVRNLLDYARRREPKLRPCDLRTVAQEALEFLDGELARTRVVWSLTGDGPLPIQADPDRLHQVLVNLVLNAAQAMDGQETPRTLRVLVTSLEPAQAVLEVRDSGPGFPEGLLSKLFQPFVTTKPQGTGLGLVVARSIVEEHGGSLDAANAPDGGAVFRITLPLLTRPADA